MIGVIGGMGPMSGAYFFQILLKKAVVKEEADHLPVIMISDPKIHDRSAFLEGLSDLNPAEDIVKKIAILKDAGASIIAIPCNQIFAPSIFNSILKDPVLADLELINLIDELHQHIIKECQEGSKIGILARTGACKQGIFDRAAPHGMHYLPEELQAELDLAIASKKYGLKYHFNPMSDQAKSIIHNCLTYFKDINIDNIILGCTELSIAVNDESYKDAKIIDTNEVLAVAAINRYKSLNKIEEIDISSN